MKSNPKYPPTSSKYDTKNPPKIAKILPQKIPNTKNPDRNLGLFFPYNTAPGPSNQFVNPTVRQIEKRLSESKDVFLRCCQTSFDRCGDQWGDYMGNGKDLKR